MTFNVFIRRRHACLKKVRNVTTVYLLEFDTIPVFVQHRDTLPVVLQTGEQNWFLSVASQYFVLPGPPGQNVLQSLGVRIDGGKQDGSLHDIFRHPEVRRTLRVVSRETLRWF